MRGNRLNVPGAAKVQARNVEAGCVHKSCVYILAAGASGRRLFCSNAWRLRRET